MNFHSLKEDVRACPNIRDNRDVTIQSQYSASSTIIDLVDGFRANISPDFDATLFYESVFDVDTAEGVGLDIWGRIVAMPRNLTLDVDEYLGFYGSLLEPFDQAPIWRNTPASEVYELADMAYRRLIMWKALANISTADAASLNRLLGLLFKNGEPVYVLEVGIMRIRLVIRFLLEHFQRSILKSYGLLARGAGVGFEWLEVPGPVLGFAGTELEPFGQGVFFIGSIIKQDNKGKAIVWR